MVESNLFGDWMGFVRLKLVFSYGEEGKVKGFFGWKGLVLKMDEFVLNFS